MKLDHSSLLADTGWSEIELDRMGLTPIERESFEPVDLNEGMNEARYNPQLTAILLQTLYPFKGTYWYEDEDVQGLLRREYLRRTGAEYDKGKVISPVRNKI